MDTHGWAVMLVAGQSPVAYTVGMTGTFGLPELAVSGLDPEHAQELLNSVALRLSRGELTLEEGKLYDTVLEGYPARFRQLGAAEVDELKMAQVLAPEGSQVAAWQLHWPDPQGLFWDDPASDPRYAAIQDIVAMLAPEDRRLH